MTIHSPPPTRPELRLPIAVLDRLMPMHLSIDPRGQIRHAGPTIRKMLGWDGSGPPSIFEHVEIRRPQGVDDVKALMQQAGSRLSLALKTAPDLQLRGVLLPVEDGGGAIIDISLGLYFARAVAEFSLTLHDFSPCDQTVELLYLHEANTSTTRLSTRLSERLQSAHAAAQYQARTDVLTGLSNRRAMDDELERLLSDKNQDFTLLHLDLDLFKEVNDTHGHAAGDAVLMNVGAILSRELRRNDFPARIGGDEFLVLLRPTVGEEVAGRIAQRLIQRIEAPLAFEGIECAVSASIGIVMTTRYSQRPTMNELMADADAALYRAKHAGRGRYVVHSQAGLH